MFDLIDLTEESLGVLTSAPFYTRGLKVRDLQFWSVCLLSTDFYRFSDDRASGVVGGLRGHNRVVIGPWIKARVSCRRVAYYLCDPQPAIQLPQVLIRGVVVLAKFIPRSFLRVPRVAFGESKLPSDMTRFRDITVLIRP